MLTTSDVEKIVVDLETGAPVRIKGKDADDFRKVLAGEIAEAKKHGWKVQIPFEVPYISPNPKEYKGGTFSGDMGHSGRPGLVGGSGGGGTDWQGRPLKAGRVLAGGNLTKAETEIIDLAGSNAMGRFDPKRVDKNALDTFKVNGVVKYITTHMKKGGSYELTPIGHTLRSQLDMVRKRLANKLIEEKGKPYAQTTEEMVASNVQRPAWERELLGHGVPKELVDQATITALALTMQEVVKYETQAQDNHRNFSWRVAPKSVQAKLEEILRTKERKHFTIMEAREVGNKIGVDWKKIDMGQFQKGMNEELEHGTIDPTTDITHDDPIMTGKIAWTHLKTDPDSYRKED